MKKKSLLIVAVLTFVLSFAFAACGETETPHTHEYTAYEWVEGSTPTETEAGKATATCSACGESTTVDVPELTDESVWTVTVTDATCTVDGEKTYTSKYGTVKVGIAASHKFGELVAAKAATCETAGNVAYYHCTVCDKNFAEDGTTEITDVTIEAKGHNYGNIIAAVAATCTHEGNIAYYHCVDCGKYFNADKEELNGVEDTVIAKLQHAYGTLHAAVEPTCHSEGNVAYYECAECHKYFDEDHDEIESYVIQKTQHNFADSWEKGDENGHTRACTNEGCTEKETVPHNYEGSQCYSYNNDEHRVYCTVCNYEHLERHEFGDWTKEDDANHVQVCAKCNKKITEKHSGGTATCKERAVCNVCHEAYGSYADHVLGADGVCTVCGKTPNAVYSKTYSAFTVDASGSVSTSVNALLTFDANGKAEGVTGSVGIIKRNGEFEDEDWNGTEYYKITDSAVYIRYIDKDKGTVQFVSSYYKATKSSSSGKYGTPTLTETTYNGYITGTNGFIFIPQGYGSNIVLVPTDTPVTADSVAAAAFGNNSDLYGKIFIKYSGTEAHSVYYAANSSASVVCIDATVTDFDGAEVAPASFKTARAMIVKDKDGKVIAKYGYNGKDVVVLDEWAGKYAGNLGTVTVWGNGEITLSDNSVGVYDVVADQEYNIVVRVYNKEDVVAYYEVAANNVEYTYTVEIPEVVVTYNLGDYGKNSEVDSLKGITYTLAAAPTPTSDAVIFKGWTVGDDEETVYAAGSKIVLTGNVTVTAVWATKTKINIVNEKGDNQTIYAGAEDTLSETLKDYIPTVEGEEFYYWEIGGRQLSSNAKVGETELTVTAVWKKKYTLTIVYGNGLADGTETYFEGYIPDPEEPAFTAGKVFDGWFTDAACETAYIPEALSGDTLAFTIYAKWVAGMPLTGTSYGLYASLSGNSSQLYSIYGEERYYLTINEDGLITDSDSYTDKSKVVTFDETTNTFAYNGNSGKYFPEYNAFAVYKWNSSGERTSLKIYFVGATAVPLTDVSKNGYSYQYGKYAFIMAKLTRNGETKPLTIFVDGDDFYFDVIVEKETTDENGETVFEKLDRYSSISYGKIVKVYNADKSVLIATMGTPSRKYTLYKSLGTAGEYTATVDGVTSEDKVVLDDYGVNITFGSLSGTYTLNSDKSAYDVYLDSNKVYYSMTIDKATMSAALVKVMVTVSFDLNTVSGVDMGTFASVSVNKNISASLAEYKPTKDGYVFKGWYTTAELATSVSSVTPAEDITVYAKWAKECTVSFVTAHGTAPASFVVEQNQWAYPNGAEYKLEDTEDYAFYGWYVEGYNSNKVITGGYQVSDDTAFVALWKEKVTLTIKYVAGETEVITAKTVKIATGRTINLDAYKPTDVERGNYVFRSFYKDGDEAMTAIDDITVADGETAIVIAKMEMGLTLTVKYQDNKVADKAYVVGSGDALDLSAAKGVTYADGTDTFFVEGLYIDETYATAFTATSITENTTVYAKWIKAGTYTMVNGTKGFVYNDENGYWESNNKGANSSSATMTITAVDGPIVIMFGYACGGEGSGSQWWDYLSIKKADSEIVKYKQGSSTTESTLKVVGPMTVQLNVGETLVFTYKKDSSGNGTCDFARIYNLTINGVGAELTA